MGPSIWQLLIVLVIVLLLFGTKRLKNFGGDLGTAIKGFKKAVGDGDKEKLPEADSQEKNGETIDGEVTSKDNEKA